MMAMICARVWLEIFNENNGDEFRACRAGPGRCLLLGGMQADPDGVAGTPEGRKLGKGGGLCGHRK